MRVIWFLALLALSGCGLNSTLPDSSETQPSEVDDRVVMISEVEVSSSGSTVTCEINEALVGPGIEIPIFLEFEGTEVERVQTENQSSHTFSIYKPPSQGLVVCVVEYANAEFESQSWSISPD